MVLREDKTLSFFVRRKMVEGIQENKEVIIFLFQTVSVLGVLIGLGRGLLMISSHQKRIKIKQEWLEERIDSYTAELRSKSDNLDSRLGRVERTLFRGE